MRDFSLFLLANALLFSLATSQELFGKAGRGGYLSWRKYTNSFKVICYMTNWAQYRPNATKFVPSDVNPFLCTHIIYAFAAINTTTHEIKAFEWNDESKKELVGRYEEFNNLKLVNPNLKTMLAVGGWNMGSKPFSDMSKNETHRQTFIRSAVKLLRKYKFDGLDLDWEFPAKREGSRDEDKDSFSFLVRDLRDAFYNEALATRKEQLLLSAAVSAEKFTILKAYDIENIVANLDFVGVMSYDYHGSWDKKSGHNSPLFASQYDSNEDKRLTVDWTMRLYLTLGVPLNKLIMGIPFYGRSFTLKNKNNRLFNAETTGDGMAGESTRESGFLSYGFEICKYLKTDNWTRVWSRERQTPYAYKSNQWVGYDDEESIKAKLDYVIENCLGGAMIWSIDLDDFKGFCSDKPYPLTRLVSAKLKERNRKMCSSKLKKIENDWDVKNYLLNVVKWVPSPSSSSTEVSAESTEDLSRSTRFSNMVDTTRIATFKTFKNSISFSESTSSPEIISKNPIYEIDNKSEKLNELMMQVSAYQNQNTFNSNENILDQILKQFLSNITNFHFESNHNQNQNQYQYQYQYQNQKVNTVTVAPIYFQNDVAWNTASTPTEQIHLFADNPDVCEHLPDGEFVRDPYDCSSFYVCVVGRIGKRSTCDQGLVFDFKLKVCNWKSQVMFKTVSNLAE